MMYIICMEKIKINQNERDNMNQIVTFLMNHSGSSFAHILTETDPINHTQKNDASFAVMFPSHTMIRKIGSRNVSIGNNYQTAVNNRLDKTGNESSFVVDKQSRDWSERLTEGLVQHKTTKEFYLEYYYLNANESEYKYVWEDNSPLTEGELTMVMSIFKKVYESKKQAEAGLDKEEQVKVNLVKIDNVRMVKAFGETVYN
jgi:hypothetical protein